MRHDAPMLRGRGTVHLLSPLCLFVSMLCLPAPAAGAAGKATVEGHVIQGEERIQLKSVAAFRRGPELVLLLTDKPIPAGSAQDFSSKWLEGTGQKGVEMVLLVEEPAASDERSLYVRFLPGDGTAAYDSGPHPLYELAREAVGSERVAGRLHGTIVGFPEHVEVDVTFSAPIE